MPGSEIIASILAPNVLKSLRRAVAECLLVVPTPLECRTGGKSEILLEKSIPSDSGRRAARCIEEISAESTAGNKSLASPTFAVSESPGATSNVRYVFAVGL